MVVKTFFTKVHFLFDFLEIYIFLSLHFIKISKKERGYV